ncbi:Cytochrome P450 2U1 [Hypsibius exemplaris]|uniref:Cytochrome P450 2U1 n=1 Tax=Hypsibius exemplaris TaxID=2072580 RepID=A0A9X6RMC0_HYPEX|nr:Cytochrome P450 2U1 [Hypsibius exemplaris]
MSKETHLYFTDLSREYGDVVSFYLGNRLTVVLSSPATIREAYRKTEFSGRPRNYLVKLYNPLFTGIVDASYSTTWKKHRHFAVKSLSAFGLGKSSFEAQILAESQHFSNILAIHPMALDPGDFVVAAISNLICVMVFGHRFEYSDKEFQSILHSLRETFSSLVGDRSRDYIPLLRLVPNKFVTKHVTLFEEVKTYIRRQIEEHKRTGKPGEARDYIDAFLTEMDTAKRTDFTENWLVNVVFDFFAAGTETTATALRWTFLYLAKYPEVQERVLGEIREVLADGQAPQYEDLKRMPFTDAVMCEILRLCSVAPLALVHSATEEGTIGGFHVPNGTDIYLNLWAMHHDERLWNEPMEFRPERFLGMDGQCRKDFEAYLPFGTGHRGCMGEQLAKMEFFIFLVTTIRTFSVTFPIGLKPDPIEGTYKLVYEPKTYDLLIQKR